MTEVVLCNEITSNQKKKDLVMYVLGTVNQRSRLNYIFQKEMVEGQL